MRFNYFIIFMILVLAGMVSCKKFVAVDAPATKLATASVFNSDAGGISAMSGIYSNMMQTVNGFASGGLTLYSGLAADELNNFSTNISQAEFYKNAISSGNGNNQKFWAEGYNRIYATNSILEAIKSSTGMTDSVKLQLEGEARFIRAFCHFILVNLYGDVPLVLTTAYQDNAVMTRSSVSSVYQQIIIDLLAAQQLLKTDYSVSNGERVRPNKWAATALLARVYLYTGDWQNAVTQASSIIANNSVFSLPANFNNVFLKNSNESIWQLIPVRTNVNTNEGESFILNGTPDNVALPASFPQIFETGDNRKINWMNSITVSGNTYYYPFKYKIKSSASISEYYTVLRLAEQYLIRAEALVKLNNTVNSTADLNTIRNRAGLTSLPATLTQDQCLAAVEQERRVELFCEWGHRWFDLKRTGRATALLLPVKGQNWQSTDALFPIPQTELANNPNITQNPGY